MSSLGVQLHIQDHHVIMDNGILQVTLSNPDGIVTGIQYNGIDNVLEVLDEEANRGYWDLVWSETGSTGTTGTFDPIIGTKLTVIVESEEQVEISFTREWNHEDKNVPLNIDKRFVMLRNSSGFYSYAIYEHLKEWPPFNLPQTRIVFKLSKEKFQYMAIADNRQRNMPLPDDRSPERSQILNSEFPEALLLVNPIEPQYKGEVDDKYQYSCENQNLRVHGWICMDPHVGFWQITPSDEFRSGGPLKQNLTSHVGPYCLAMMTEVQSWPYEFPASNDFPPSKQRGNVSGRICVRDSFVSDDHILSHRAYVGLAPPGDVGSWQRDCKGYQFWTRAGENGYYSIKNIREGNYNLYAWVPGFIGDYRYGLTINITPGCDIDLGGLVYEPPRDGPTLWEIGFPDRTASGFYVPDPSLEYINKLYVNHPDRFRQWGLWERYAELYPNEDLVYTIGTSDYTKDWFFAQVTRKKDDGTYQGTTWKIKFQLDNVSQTKIYKLRLALATANIAELQIRINDSKAEPPLFTTGVIGHDNTICRHGIHGLYWLYTIDVPGTLLVKGDNAVFLTQAVSTSPFVGIMYDYIRLEAPSSSTSA
ncbi:putative rhamnogalacturonate lyase B [Rosa sericea]